MKIAIIGYGNLARGVERAASYQEDIEVVGVFTRRKLNQATALGNPLYPLETLDNFQEAIDVCILCGGSAKDLPGQTPSLAANFNTVDSFDNHAQIPEHFAKVDAVAKANKKVSVISAGWDPGLFSIHRLMGEAVLPVGESYTFWGKGVSQGHSDAIRRIEGVKYGIQYTVPDEEIIEKITAGEKLTLSTRDKHKRVCYVVAGEEADQERIRQSIVTMPSYFADYDTSVYFIDEAEFFQNHTGMPHGGKVLRIGETSEGTHQVYQFSLKLESNPEFTSSVLLTYARACYRLSAEGQSGAYTVLDIPPKYLSKRTDQNLYAELL